MTYVKPNWTKNGDMQITLSCINLQEPLFKAFGDKIAKSVVAALEVVTQAFR